jgi:hypothetical protein
MLVDLEAIDHPTDAGQQTLPGRRAAHSDLDSSPRQGEQHRVISVLSIAAYDPTHLPRNIPLAANALR